MNWPYVSRTRHDAEITALRQRVLDTEARHDQAEADRRRLAGQYTHLHDTWSGTAIVNDCLTDANLTVARRLTRALRACARYRAALADATHRADQLQHRLDDALGLNTSQIDDGRLWQQTRPDKKGMVL